VNSMNPISGFIAVLLLALAAGLYALGLGIVLPVVCVLLAVIVLAALQLASQWDRVVILRAGKFNRTVGPGVFLMLPIIDSVAAWVDTRTRSIVFKAEDTLTSDTVPVNVDAVLFLTVIDPEKAALQVTDYLGSISLAAQTALRDSISSTAPLDQPHRP